ncbi:MAG TPA: LysR family transcriptional regulator [Kineosporiaceae bacterium]|nr:LysR family transcriptional regulator [Kineosporiaceae bacterium]
MDVRQLRYLVTVVEERSISRAAARLNMSQPPLSTMITQLERELGVKLLHRHARGVEPTEAGSYLTDNARRLMATMAEISSSATAIGNGRRGRLSLAAVSGTSWELLPTSLRVFAEDLPDVEIEIVEVTAMDVVERVRSQRADVGLVYATNTGYIERLKSLDLEAAMVRREPMVAVLPTRLAQAQPVDLTRLTDERWLVPAKNADWPELPDLVHEAWHRAGSTPARTYTIATLDAALNLVAAGFGVALMPFTVTRLTRAGVAAAPIVQHLPPIESAAVWRRNERPSPVLARFLRASMATPEPDRLDPAHARPDSPDL